MPRAIIMGVAGSAGFRVDISMSPDEIAEDAKAQLEGMTEWRRA